MHSGFHTIRAQMPMNCRAQDRSVLMTDELQEDIDRIIEIWSECRVTHAGSGPWLFGAFSIADAMYAPVAFRFASYGVFVEKQAEDYMQFLLSRPALQQWQQCALQEKEINQIYEVGLV
jgi:glutathione S-transferase